MHDAITTGRRLLLAPLLLLPATLLLARDPACPAEEAVQKPTPRASYQVVPLTGEPLYQAAEDGHCVPFLRPLLAHPNWELRISAGTSGCLGDFLHDSFAVHADGTATWSRPGAPVRELALAPDDLDAIRTLDTLSCAATEDERGYYVGWYRIGLGADALLQGTPSIPRSSAMAKRLDEIFENMVSMYQRRILGLGTARAWLTANYYDGARYQVELVDHTVRVTHKGRVLAEETLDDAGLVDLIDRARMAPALPPAAPHKGRDEDPALARGELHFAGYRYPLAISWSEPEMSGYDVIRRAVANAEYTEREKPQTEDQL